MANPTGAPPGYFYDAAIKAYVRCPPGTYSRGGATAPTADPGGTYSAAGAAAPTVDPAGTYSSPYALDRLVIEWKNSTPDNSVLAFHNETEVANYYGATSIEAQEAQVFFGPNDVYGLAGATEYFVRWAYKQRPHVLGANLAPAGLAALQQIHGTLEINFNGVNYSGQVNLAGVTSFLEAAQELTVDMNANLPVLARAEGSIAPVSVRFTGSVNQSHLTVTNAAPGSIQIGAVLSGKGIQGVAGSIAPVQITGQLTGTPGGDGTYTLFTYGGNTPVEGITESYGILTAADAKPWDFGRIAVGDDVSGPANIAFSTAVISDLGGGKWLVNNAQTVPTETIGFRATPFQVYLDWNNIPIIGKTENNDFFDIAPGGLFGFNNVPSSISYAWSPLGDPTATELGLTQAAGAMNTSPGGQPTSVAQFMADVIGKMTNHFGSVETNLPSQDAAFQQWDLSPAGDPYVFLTNLFTPAGQATPVTDPAGTHSGPGATAPTRDSPGAYLMAAPVASASMALGDSDWASITDLLVKPGDDASRW